MIASAMPPLLVLVHGIRITLSKRALRRHWLKYLRLAVPDITDRARVELLYWVGAAGTNPGHPLVNLIRALGDEAAEFILAAKGANLEDDTAVPDKPEAGEADDAAELRRAIKGLTVNFARRTRTAVQAAIEDGLLPLPDVPHPTGPWAVASASARRLSALFLDELHAYLFDRERRYAMRDHCRNQLDALMAEEPDAPVALWGNSLGALILHDILQQAVDEGNPYQIDLLVTSGNPLCVPAIHERVPIELRVPPGVRRWVNMVAEHDFVAGPGELAAVVQPCEATGVGVEDVRFVNPFGRWTWLESFHRPEGYLQSEPLKQVLEEWLAAVESRPAAAH